MSFLYKRREFITLLGGAAAAWPFLARAQQPAMPVVGFLHTASPAGYAPFVAEFLQGLKEIGYVEGKNVTVDYRWADGHSDRLPSMADDLVRRQVAVIVGSTSAALAAKAATDKIPIVFISGSEPVSAGLVASLNRPGGNVTGVSFIVSELIPKRLELLREFVPKAATAGALVNPNYPASDLQVQELQDAAAATGLQIRIVTAGTEREIDAAFASLAQQGTDMLLVANDPFFMSRRNQIIALAARHALAASYAGREYVNAGGLVSYGPSLTDIYRLAGIYAGKVLNGTKPADLPVQQPTKFDFAVNLKTAKALGLDVPAKLLALADEVIE
jgi:ABC-type uncharacterized transport system substrate-binding protein